MVSLVVLSIFLMEKFGPLPLASECLPVQPLDALVESLLFEGSTVVMLVPLLHLHVVD